MKVAVIGMGNMGCALADALLAANYSVTVWNRSAQKCAAALAAGAVHASKVDEAVRASDLIIFCLSDSEAVSALLSNRATAEGLLGRTVLQLSQSTPEQSIALSQWARKNGTSYLDGSIMGMPSDVRSGRCMIVYSGDAKIFASCRKVLTDLGGRPRHLGCPPELASTFDKAFFSALYAHFAGLIHGAAICRAAGASLETYFELMVGGWDWQGADADYARMMSARDYSSEQVTLAVHAYAFEQVRPTCQALGVNDALPKAIEDAMKRAIARGHGGDEIAALIEVFKPT